MKMETIKKIKMILDAAKLCLPAKEYEDEDITERIQLTYVVSGEEYTLPKANKYTAIIQWRIDFLNYLEKGRCSEIIFEKYFIYEDLDITNEESVYLRLPASEIQKLVKELQKEIQNIKKKLEEKK